MDKPQVDRINLDGELGIVNSARVSYNAWSKALTEKDKDLIKFLKEHQHGSPFYHPQKMFLIKDFDIRKIYTLDRRGIDEYYIEEWDTYIVRASYFSYCQYKEYFDKHISLDCESICNEDWFLTMQSSLYKASRIPYLSFRITTSIVVADQLKKHSGPQNQISYRYVTSILAFFIPNKWRKKSPSNKQGSLQNEFVKEKKVMFFLGFKWILKIIQKWYEMNIANKVCGEQARMLLPVATYTSFVWTLTLQDYARICYLRLKPDAQLETREVVEQIYELCKAEYPKTFDRLIELVGDRMNKSFKNL
jgi:thymidylate synthase ThyX